MSKFGDPFSALCIPAVIMFTVAGYDCVLTFSHEVEYIWTKSWTWVSTLFIIVRYAGLCNFTMYPLLEIVPFSTGLSLWVFVLPSLEFLKVFWHLNSRSYDIFSIANKWMFLLFLGAADLVMTLRVWAMYNRSRPILIILLTLLSLEIISGSVTDGIYSNTTLLKGNSYLFDAVPIWDPSSETPFLSFSAIVANVLMVTNATALCILAITQFVRDSMQMYNVTKQWQINQYMKMLATQGTLYFVAIFLINLFALFPSVIKIPSEGLLLTVPYMATFVLTSRFVLSIRALYARDIRGRCGSGIDTGFGLSFSRGDTCRAAIVFADVERNAGTESIEEESQEGRDTE